MNSDYLLPTAVAVAILAIDGFGIAVSLTRLWRLPLPVRLASSILLAGVMGLAHSWLLPLDVVPLRRVWYCHTVVGWVLSGGVAAYLCVYFRDRLPKSHLAACFLAAVAVIASIKLFAPLYCPAMIVLALGFVMIGLFEIIQAIGSVHETRNPRGAL